MFEIIITILTLYAIGSTWYNVWLTKKSKIVLNNFEELDEENNELFDDYQRLQVESVENMKLVVDNINKFILKSQYLQYNEDVKQILTYLRSFVIKLTNDIEAIEREYLGTDEEDDTNEPRNPKPQLPDPTESRRLQSARRNDIRKGKHSIVFAGVRRRN